MPGPVPMHSSERRRRNKVDIDTVVMIGDVEVPPARSSWHEIAREWYASLAESGQSRFYEPSDWIAAQLVADQMSRLLRRKGLSPTMFQAVWTAMSDLLTTEGERRRVRLEIERKKEPPAAGDGATVIPFARYKDL